METNVSYTVAGTFILILLFMIILAVIWLSAGLNNKDYTYYKVSMKESVSGLNRDGPVEFNGVNVGTVSDMKINRKNPQLVELILQVEKDTPITAGTRAKLGMRALTGVAYMLLEDKGDDRRPLVKQPGQRYAVIITTPSILVRLDTTLTQISQSFNQMSSSVKSLLDKENLLWVKQILQAGKGSLRIIETQTIPAANMTMTNIESITRNLTSVSSDMKQNPAVIIRGKEQSTKLGPGEK